MKSAKKPSGAIRQNYDKIIMVLVLIALLASAGLLVVKLQQGADKVETTRGELDAVNPKAAQPLDASALDALYASITEPYQIDGDIKLLVGEKRVSSIPDGLPIPYAAEVCPFTGAPQPAVLSVDELDTDSDGIPDVWEEKFKLNPYDVSDAQLDGDGDGFSNYEEFMADTDPTDVADAPPPTAKLRLVRVEIIPFKLLFKGVSKYPDGSDRYQLNLRGGGRTHFARMDQEIEGFTVSGYNADGARGPELVLMSGDKEIVLVLGRTVDETARRAYMIMLTDGERIQVNNGETFSLKGVDYKVVDIRDDRVVIRDESAGKDIDVGRITLDERERLSGNAAPRGIAP